MAALLCADFSSIIGWGSEAWGLLFQQAHPDHGDPVHDPGRLLWVRGGWPPRLPPLWPGCPPLHPLHLSHQKVSRLIHTCMVWWSYLQSCFDIACGSLEDINSRIILHDGLAWTPPPTLYPSTPLHCLSEGNPCDHPMLAELQVFLLHQHV